MGKGAHVSDASKIHKMIPHINFRTCESAEVGYECVMGIDGNHLLACTCRGSDFEKLGVPGLELPSGPVVPADPPANPASALSAAYAGSSAVPAASGGIRQTMVRPGA